MKDHEIRELVNTLTSIAKAYGETQQLRQRIHDALVPKIETLRDERNRLFDAHSHEMIRADKAEQEIEKLRSEKRMYQDTANALEVAVCMYTHFTGSPPYVGDEGLVLAIKEQADRLRKFQEIWDIFPEFKLLLKAGSKSQMKRMAAQMKDES